MSDIEEVKRLLMEIRKLNDEWWTDSERPNEIEQKIKDALLWLEHMEEEAQVPTVALQREQIGWQELPAEEPEKEGKCWWCHNPKSRCKCDDYDGVDYDCPECGGSHEVDTCPERPSMEEK